MRSRNGGLSYARLLGNGRVTVSHKGGPLMAEIDGPGGPLSAGDQIFRDRTNMRHERQVHEDMEGVNYKS